MKRRTLLASLLGSGVTVAIYNIVSGNDNKRDGKQTDDKPTGSTDPTENTNGQNGQNGSTTETNETDEITPTKETNETSKNETSENESQYPDAADPAPNPDVATNESQHATPEEMERSQVSKGDITVVEKTVAANQYGAVARVVIRNDGDVTSGAIEVIVQFATATGEELGMAMNGTTGVAPGDEASVDVEVRGSEYSVAETCVVTISV